MNICNYFLIKGTLEMGMRHHTISIPIPVRTRLVTCRRVHQVVQHGESSTCVPYFLICMNLSLLSWFNQVNFIWMVCLFSDCLPVVVPIRVADHKHHSNLQVIITKVASRTCSSILRVTAKPVIRLYLIKSFILLQKKGLASEEID